MEVSDREATEKELEDAILEASMESFDSAAATKKRSRTDISFDNGYWETYVPQEHMGKANQGRLPSSQPVLEADYEYPESVLEMVMNGFELER